MAIYVQRGSVIDYKNVSIADISANEVVTLGTRIGVAGSVIPVGVVGAVHVTGVFDFPATTTEAFTVGQQVFFKEGVITSDSTDAVPAGWVVEPKSTSGAIARVKIG